MPGPSYDAVIVGSGFGGAVTAWAMARAGRRVLVLERGGRVPRGPGTWGPGGTLERTPFYPAVARDAGGRAVRAPSCVGGGSVFFGGVSLRMREADFAPDPEGALASGPAWPFGYDELEPFYDRAEALLDVAGRAGADPVEPPRRGPYPQAVPPLSPTAARLAGAARRRGLEPFPLPLAINFRTDRERPACARCSTCDTFACASGAKNDVAATALAAAVRAGASVLPGVTAEGLEADGRRVRAVHCRTAGGEALTVRGRRFALAAGALGTPVLLLASGLDAANPAGHAVGRHLVRHCSSIVMGLFPRRLDAEPSFHKQIGLHDLYFGDPAGGPAGRLGSVQQVSHPPVGLLERELPRGLRFAAGPLRERLTGLLAMAEDQPNPHNRVRLGPSGTVVEHRYTRRDLAARARLVAVARQVLAEAGAIHLHEHPIETFSHALGTVRMGADPRTAPVDAGGRFRGVDNLHVVDGSALPTAAAVNPSLTIAAHALRAAEHALELDEGVRGRVLAAA